MAARYCTLQLAVSHQYASVFSYISLLKIFDSSIISGIGSCEMVDCIVYSAGRVACVMPCTHQGHCDEFGFANWPYDKHKCEFTFGSWMKSGEELNYDPDRVKVTSKKTKVNNMWKLNNVSIEYNKGDEYEDANNETYPTIALKFDLERENQLYVTGITIPSIVLMLANIAVFYFQPQSARRLIICILVIISHNIYMDYLYWM